MAYEGGLSKNGGEPVRAEKGGSWTGYTGADREPGARNGRSTVPVLFHATVPGCNPVIPMLLPLIGTVEQ